MVDGVVEPEPDPEPPLEEPEPLLGGGEPAGVVVGVADPLDAADGLDATVVGVAPGAGELGAACDCAGWDAAGERFACVPSAGAAYSIFGPAGACPAGGSATSTLAKAPPTVMPVSRLTAPPPRRMPAVAHRLRRGASSSA